MKSERVLQSAPDLFSEYGFHCFTPFCTFSGFRDFVEFYRDFCLLFGLNFLQGHFFLQIRIA